MKHGVSIYFSSGIAALAAGALSTTALAQQDLQLEEVVVTAQKVESTVMKTPIALTVFSGDALQEQGVVSVEDLQNIAPGLNIDRSPFGVNLNIRGVTTTDNTSKGSQGVGFNVDGVPVGRPAEISLAFLDVARVEVLRGPQGTLYGKSTTGGAINVISNRPKDEFEGSVAVELGNFNTRRGEVMINMPVSDSFALRAAASYNVRDGFLKPVLGNYQIPVSAPARNDENNQVGRLSGLWTISDNASLLLSATFGRVGGVGPGAAIYSRIRDLSGAAQRYVYYNPFATAMDQHFNNYSAEFNVEMGPVQLTYVGADRTFKSNNVTSTTYNPAGNQGGRYGWTQYRGTFNTEYHELRFANASAQRIEWVAGANYFNEDLHESDHNWSAPVTNATLAGSINGIDPLNNTVHKSKGVFAQFGLHATEALKFTLGARHSSDMVRRRGTFAAGPGPWLDPQGRPCVAPNDCVGTPNNGDQSANKVTWRAGADYQLSDAHMIYVSVATGYKEGGFNDFGPSGSSESYIPEELLAYEGGYKGQILSNLQFSSAYFYYDYKKMQVSSTVNINGSNVIFTRPVPAKVQGLENELLYKIDAANLLNASLSFQKSEYTNFRAGAQQNVNWTGLRINKTPDTVATLAYAHTWFVGDDATIEARVSSKYSSSYEMGDFVNAIRYTQKSFTRSDFTLAYDNGSFELQGYVRNIEDDLQYQGAAGNGNSTVPEYPTVNVSDPRTFGVRASIDF